MPELVDKIFDYLHGNITLNDKDFDSLKAEINEAIEKSKILDDLTQASVTSITSDNPEKELVENIKKIMDNAEHSRILQSQNKSLSELFVKWNQRIIGDEEYSRSVIKLLQEKYHEIAERIDEE